MAQESPLAPRGESDLKIRRGRVDSVDLYEIKDTELEQLERGSPSDLQLNFSIFLLSIAFSGACALATAQFVNSKIEMGFYVVTVCGTLIGAYLLIAWWRSHTSLRELCKRIRQRIPPEAQTSPPDGATDGNSDARPRG